MIHEIIKLLLGTAFILFLPGLVICYAIFPQKEIEIIQRIGLGFAFSITVVPLVMFYLNLIGVRISLLNLILEVIGIILISCLFWYLRIRNHAAEK